MSKKIDDETQRLLKQIYDDCFNEDIAVRQRQIRMWRRLKLLWEGFNRVWYSEVAHDWRIWDEATDQDTDQSYYDKPVNIFRAYLESIIAALSVTIPAIKCFPDDADNPLDLATARAGDKIAQLVYRHNDVSMLWLHALFTFVTEGMTACYSYPKEDEKYGTYDEKEHSESEEEREVTTCSLCGYQISSNPIESNPNSLQPNNGVNQPNNKMSGMGMQQQIPFPTTMSSQSNPNSQLPETLDSNELQNQERDEFGPDDEDVVLHHALNEGQDLCPSCMQMMDPTILKEKFIVTRLVGVTTKPKARMCLEVYGGLYIKVAAFAKSQAETPYLIFSKEEDYALVAEEYENVRNSKKIRELIKSGNQAGSYNLYDQWGRLSPQYQGAYPLNVVTVNKCWIRPGKFNILPDDDAKKLKRRFPDGAKVVIVNDEFAFAENEALDDCWTLSMNPLSDFLYFEPLGQGLVSVQDITNDLISLVLQTIEHGIGQTFADPGVLNFKAYEQTEVTPGGVFPAVAKSGKSLQEGFHELRTATLSGEVLPFFQQTQSLAQLVSGALPSLFGGQLEGSETASQYSMSRAQALQRLQNVWKMFTIWWKQIFGKTIPMFIESVKEDEHDVEKNKDGNFINVFIRKAELEGKIGKVELEANENLPLTWSQIKDTIEKLLQNGNPEVLKILVAPENLPLIHDALGLTDFYVPNEDDVVKQYDEIKLLLNSSPIETGDPMNPEMPSVDIDPIYDNHQIEFEICRKWIISEAGRQIKTDNEEGYRNVLLHGKLHYMQMQQAMVPSDGGVTPGEKPNPNLEAPIEGESNVQTVQ